MKLNDEGATHAYDGVFIAAGFVAAVFFWLMEAFIHAYVLHVGSFARELIRPTVNEVWMRLLIMGFLIAFGFYASSKVSMLRRSEERLLDARDKARTYFEASSAILIVIGTDGKVIDINRTGCEVLGCERAGIIGNDWFENFLPEREKEDVLAVFHELLSGDVESAKYYENPVLSKGHGERVIAWHNRVLVDKNGAVYATLSSGMDITERKKAEDELRENFDEVERMNRLMVGRELKIVELKEEIISLKARVKELEAASINR